ncbi:hypothetical protein [Streptomyces sp. NPDC101234]
MSGQRASHLTHTAALHPTNTVLGVLVGGALLGFIGARVAR